MAMEHKAFLFCYRSFEKELRPILEEALTSGDCASLIDFIQGHLNELKDPYEGEPLDEEWESKLERKDADEYGDFALTRYYDPTEDIGLGPAWDEIQDLVDRQPSFSESPILGSVVGPPDHPFDPGKMGAYFQSEDQVVRNHRLLVEFAKRTNSKALTEAIEILEKAENAERGLYVTF